LAQLLISTVEAAGHIAEQGVLDTAEALQRIHTQDGRPVDEIRRVLLWYQDNYRYRYTPKVRSGRVFQEKYKAIHAAFKDRRSPMVDLNDKDYVVTKYSQLYQREIYNRVLELDWRDTVDVKPLMTACWLELKKWCPKAKAALKKLPGSQRGILEAICHLERDGLLLKWMRWVQENTGPCSNLANYFWDPVRFGKSLEEHQPEWQALLDEIDRQQYGDTR